MSTDKSTAGSGHGTENPESVDVFSRKRQGKLTDIGVRWQGEEYDPRFAWILASVDSLIELSDREDG